MLRRLPLPVVVSVFVAACAVDAVEPPTASQAVALQPAKPSVWAVGGPTVGPGSMSHWDGTTWSPSSVGTHSRFTSVWGSSPSDVWAGSDDIIIGGLDYSENGEVWHYDGATWQSSFVASGDPITGVWASSPSNVWACGWSFYHYDGTRWSYAYSAGQPVRGVGGSGPSDVWAVGDLGSISHYDGQSWKPSASGTSANLEGVYAVSSTSAWAVGDGGTILHFNGSAWSASASGTSSTLFGVWGSGSADVWAAGAAGTIVHWNGSTWAPVASGTAQSLDAVSGTSATDAWAVGATVLHWDGTQWSSMSSGATDQLYGVWAGGASTSFVPDAGQSRVAWSGPFQGKCAMPVFCPKKTEPGMTVQVTVRNANGDPVSGIPASSVWATGACTLVDSANANACASTSTVYASTPTDTSGNTTLTIKGRGHCEDLQVIAKGIVLSVLSYRSYDYTVDGRADLSDLGFMADTYNKKQGDQGYNAAFDFDCDGAVNISDLGWFSNHYNHTCQ